MAFLRVLAGEHRGKVYPLDADRLVLGRDSEDLPVLDQGVSRQHAEVFRVGEMYLVRDLGSRNGTYVNDEKITEWVLRSGDRVQVGNTQLAFEDRYARPGDSRIIQFADTQSGTINTLAVKLQKEANTEAEDEHRRLQVLYRVSRILGTGENLEATMQKVARALAKTLGAEHVYLFEFDEEAEGDDIFHFVAGYDQNPVDELVVSHTILQRVRSEGRPLLSSDAMLDDRFAATDSVMIQGIKSLLCTPVVLMGKPIGAFYAVNAKLTEVFTAEDLELAAMIGMLVGNSLEMWELVESQASVYRSALKILAEVVEIREPSHRGRAQRVATYCAAISRAIGYTDARTQKMWVAGFLHEIGTIGLSDEELETAVNLDQRKVKHAAELLERIPELADVAPAIVAQGERLDGSGFPAGLQGEAVCEEAQILGVAVVLEELLNSGGSNGQPMETKDALLSMRDLAPEKFTARVINGLLISYRRNRLFREDRAIFRATP